MINNNHEQQKNIAIKLTIFRFKKIMIIELKTNGSFSEKFIYRKSHRIISKVLAVCRHKPKYFQINSGVGSSKSYK